VKDDLMYTICLYENIDGKGSIDQFIDFDETDDAYLNEMSVPFDVSKLVEVFNSTGFNDSHTLIVDEKNYVRFETECYSDYAEFLLKLTAKGVYKISMLEVTP
jgi:hypothetical protein